MLKTTASLKPSEVNKAWTLIDADGLVRVFDRQGSGDMRMGGEIGHG